MASLALHCIVSDEISDFHRMMDSVFPQGKPPLFDETVIVSTTRCEDVEAVARSYPNVIVIRFDWIQDFSAARNAGWYTSHTTHKLWLDSDDVVKPADYDKLLAIKSQLDPCDCVLIEYVYSHVDNDQPGMILPRERIVRDSPEIKWCDEIHEYLSVQDIPAHRVARPGIFVHHYRSRPYDKDRNLPILRKMAARPECTERTKFYLGKELFDGGQKDEAMQIFEPYIERSKDYVDNLTCASIRAAQYYFDKGDMVKARHYCMMAIRTGPGYAEPYSYLGTISQVEGKADEAVEHYKEALTKKPVNGMAQQIQYYGLIPNGKLAEIYLQKGDYHNANEYVTKALTYAEKDPGLLNLQKTISDMPRNGDITTIKAYAIDSGYIWEEISNGDYGVVVRLKKDTRPKVANSKPMVDIIILCYNNLPYIKATVNSILMATDYPYHIILVDAGSSDPEIWAWYKTLQGYTILGEQGKRLTYSEAANIGISVSKTPFFAILNSDLIVTHNWLQAIMDKMTDPRYPRLAATGVLSNCDIGWLINAPGKPTIDMTLPSGLRLHPGMTLDELGGTAGIDSVMRWGKDLNKINNDKFCYQDWVAGYCTIYARSAINEIGYFDPSFRNGCEDSDICRRLAECGFKMGQAYDAFVLHFGAISRATLEKESFDNYHKEDTANHVQFRRKWEYRTIAIYTGPAWEPWDRSTVDAGMAGSETWAAYIAREFARAGFYTVIYGHLKSNNLLIHDPVDGYQPVVYRNHSMILEDYKYGIIDHMICSRTVEPYKHNLHSKTNDVMVHDIWINPDPNHDLMLWKISGIACLSAWHKEFLMQHHKIPADKLWITTHGIDQDMYQASVDKVPMSVYSSSPDRGLLTLLEMMPQLRKACPEFTLIVAYGFFNWEQAALVRNNPEELELIKKIKAAMEQPGVKYVGRINKSTLAEYQLMSSVWLYPTWFTETSCVTAIENGYAGNALLSSDLAGLQTTIADSGILIPGNSSTREYRDRFESEAITLLTNESYRTEWAERARSKMSVYTWKHAARGWLTKWGEA